MKFIAKFVMIMALVISFALVLAQGQTKIDKRKTDSKAKIKASMLTKLYALGERGPGGGWVFYDKGSYSNGWQYLEAAPNDHGASLKWGCFHISIAGAKGTNIGSGKTNTEAIVNGCNEAYTAAKICSDYSGGGKDDWFLPSKEELRHAYWNLKHKGIGGFTYYAYWTSSEVTDDAVMQHNGRLHAWGSDFNGGMSHAYQKNGSTSVRCVRAF